MRLWISVALACTLFGFSGAAVADDESEREARGLFTEGNRLMESGDYVGALERYRSAYARFPSVKILLNSGTALRQLGRYAEAFDAYERYQRDPGADEAKRKEVATILLELDAKVGTLAVAVEPDGASLVVDGKPFARVPSGFSLRVEAGTHSVVAEKPGWRAAAQTVKVAAGEHSVIKLRLEEPPRAAPPTPVIAATPSVPAQRPPAPRTLLWTGIAVGALALGAAAGGIGLYGSARSDYAAFTAPSTGCSPDCLPSVWAGSQRKEGVGYALLGVAGALAIADVVIFVVQARRGLVADRSARLYPSLGGFTFGRAAE